AAAAELARALGVLRDELRSSMEPRRMIDGPAREREIAGKRAEHTRGSVQIGPTEDAIDAERATGLERANDCVRCCTYNFDVRSRPAVADLLHEHAHRRHRGAEILEADVPYPELERGIDDLFRVVDRAVVAGQHQDEIHAASWLPVGASDVG